MAHMAVLVLKTSNLGFIAKLARDLPVWIADTPDHASLRKMSAGNDGPMLTWFPLKERETLEASAFRIVHSLDEHYDESSQDPGYDALWIVGLPYEPSYLGRLTALGFTKLDPVWDGLIATK